MTLGRYIIFAGAFLGALAYAAPEISKEVRPMPARDLTWTKPTSIISEEEQSLPERPTWLNLAPSRDPAGETPSALPSPGPVTPVEKVPEPVAPPKRDYGRFRPYSILGVDTLFSYFRLDGVSSEGYTGTLLSSLNPGFRFNWKLQFTEDFSAHLAGEYIKVGFDPLTSKILAQVPGSTTGLMLGFDYRLERWLVVGLEVGAKQDLMIRALDTETISLDRVSVPRARVRAQATLCRYGDLTLGGEARLGFLLPTKTALYDIKAGTEVEGRAFLQHDLGDIAIVGAFFLKKQTQGSTFLDQSRTDMGLDFGMRWTLGR